jgi:hypothetical protein
LLVLPQRSAARAFDDTHLETSAASEPLNPRSASSAAYRPLRAAWAGTNFEHIVPWVWRMPEAWLAAMPMAQRVRSADSPSTRAPATAAPMPPAIPVAYQPHWPSAGSMSSALATRHSTSIPAIKASIRARPERGLRSARDSSANVTGPLGCTTVSRWVSSKARAAEARQLR